VRYYKAARMLALFGGRFISYYWCYEHKTTAGLTHFFFSNCVNLL